MTFHKRRRRYITLVGILGFFLSEGVSACSWCTRNEVVPLMRDKLALLKVRALPQQEGASFYNECFYDYYPKVYVITRTYFTQMCPQAIDDALYEVVRVLTYDPWFYFSNHEGTFRWGAFWERIITIFQLFDQFLTSAHVDRASGYIYESDLTSEDPDLISWWYATGKKAMFDFYALYFDYYMKLFNEGIKLEKEYHVEVYCHMLEELLFRLEGSTYYTKYEKALKRSKRLQLLLHEKKERKRWWRTKE